MDIKERHYTIFIGNKILKGRKERNITQEELANKVGVGEERRRKLLYQSLIEDTDLGAMAGIREYEDAIELLKRC